MSERKRVNISVDPKTYDRLQSLKKHYGYRSPCELVTAFVHILIDRLKDTSSREYDLPEDDGAYIDNMFEDLGNVERTPDGTVPARHNRKNIKE